jgi:D-lyxose ketol-isomerase
MFSLPGQKTPCHYHKKKTEDIFVRAGDKLIIRIWPSKFKQKKDGLKIKVLFNGSEYKEIISGQKISLDPGETVTLTPEHSHEFFGDPKGSGTLVGEVSTYNDDQGDNYFIDKVSRFPEIQEDQKIDYYLVSDYQKLI